MYCTKCGNLLTENAQFCEKCGNPVAGGINNASAPVSAAAPEVLPASMGARFANMLVDKVVVDIAFFSLCMLAAVVSDQALVVTVVIAAFIVLFGYHLVCESIWQRTIGKLITKTKVVDRAGNKPSFGKILLRTICRIIPFEFISYLLHSHPIGIHDQLSGTMVVPAHLTPEEVQRINPEELNKKSGTSGIAIVLIIIFGGLVLIAVIGILSSVVLASLNIARAKGDDAMVKSDVMTFRTEGELYYDGQNNSYAGLCASDSATYLAAASEAGDSSGSSTNYQCNDSDTAWAASVPLRTAGYYCIDSMGNTSVLSDNLPADATSCPAS